MRLNAVAVTSAMLAVGACGEMGDADQTASVDEQVELSEETQALNNAYPTTKPWLAALSWPGGSTYCTGTLVDPFTILTAASCYQGDLAPVEVRFPSTVATGRWMAKHPDFEVGGLWHANDFATITLNSPITSIAPLGLATTIPANGTWGELFGYGGIGTNCDPNPFNGQRGVSLQISSRTYLPAPQPATGSFLTFNSNTQYVCQGDWGGPALYLNKIIGVASWGGPGNSNYVAVPRLRDWVGVTVYDGLNFTGASQHFMRGFYDHPSMVAVPNDTISSMKVAPGYVVHLYREGNFGGITASYSGSVANVGAQLDNNASSITILPGATLYSHASFGGVSQSFSAGSYDHTSLNVVGNDSVSSIAVAPDMKLEACSEGGWWGDCRTFYGWNWYVGDLLNDRISSIRVLPR